MVFERMPAREWKFKPCNHWGKMGPKPGPLIYNVFYEYSILKSKTSEKL